MYVDHSPHIMLSDLTVYDDRMYYVNTLRSNMKRDGSQWILTNVESTDLYGQARLFLMVGEDFPSLQYVTDLRVDFG